MRLKWVFDGAVAPSQGARQSAKRLGEVPAMRALFLFFCLAGFAAGATGADIVRPAHSWTE